MTRGQNVSGQASKTESHSQQITERGQKLNPPDLEWVCVLHGAAHGQGHGGAGLDVEGAAHEEQHEEGGGGVEGVGGGGPAAAAARAEGAAGVAEEGDRRAGAVGGAVGAWVAVGGGQVPGGVGGTADEVSVEDEDVEVGVVDVGDGGCVGRGVAVEEGGHVGTEADPGQEVGPVGGGGGVGGVAPVGGGEEDHEGGSDRLHSCLPLISFCSGSVKITETHYKWMCLLS